MKFQAVVALIIVLGMSSARASGEEPEVQEAGCDADKCGGGAEVCKGAGKACCVEKPGCKGAVVENGLACQITSKGAARQASGEKAGCKHGKGKKTGCPMMGIEAGKEASLNCPMEAK